MIESIVQTSVDCVSVDIKQAKYKSLFSWIVATLGLIMVMSGLILSLFGIISGGVFPFLAIIGGTLLLSGVVLGLYFHILKLKKERILAELLRPIPEIMRRTMRETPPTEVHEEDFKKNCSLLLTRLIETENRIQNLSKKLELFKQKGYRKFQNSILFSQQAVRKLLVSGESFDPRWANLEEIEFEILTIKCSCMEDYLYLIEEVGEAISSSRSIYIGLGIPEDEIKVMKAHHERLLSEIIEESKICLTEEPDLKIHEDRVKRWMDKKEDLMKSMHRLREFGRAAIPNFDRFLFDCTKKMEDFNFEMQRRLFIKSQNAGRNELPAFERQLEWVFKKSHSIVRNLRKPGKRDIDSFKSAEVFQSLIDSINKEFSVATDFKNLIPEERKASSKKARLASRIEMLVSLRGQISDRDSLFDTLKLFENREKNRIVSETKRFDFLAPKISRFSSLLVQLDQIATVDEEEELRVEAIEIANEVLNTFLCWKNEDQTVVSPNTSINMLYRIMGQCISYITDTVDALEDAESIMDYVKQMQTDLTLIETETGVKDLYREQLNFLEGHYQQLIRRHAEAQSVHTQAQESLKKDFFLKASDLDRVWDLLHSFNKIKPFLERKVEIEAQVQGLISLEEAKRVCPDIDIEYGEPTPPEWGWFQDTPLSDISLLLDWFEEVNESFPNILNVHADLMGKVELYADLIRFDLLLDKRINVFEREANTILDIFELEESVDSLDNTGFEMIALLERLGSTKLAKSLKDGIENMRNMLVICRDNFELTDESQTALQS